MISAGSSGEIRNVVSGSKGEFVVTGLEPGDYTVTAKKPGFLTFQKEGIKARAGKTVVLKIRLEISGVPSRLKKIKNPFGMGIERKARSKIERELIDKAEQVPCPDGEWTKENGEAVRWPRCLNGEAVRYYADLTSRYERGDFPFTYPRLRSGRAYYYAGVKRDHAKKRWRVEMVLEYSDDCGNMCGTFFQIIRTIYFDYDLRVIEIEGDEEGAHGGIS